MNKPLIELQNIRKCFAEQNVLQNIDLTIENGEFLTLLGPSGCGKTTLLRILAGFTTPDHGQILLNGSDITQVPPEERHLNMVFQQYALFPHMTVFDNVAFGLRCQKVDEVQIKQRVTRMLEIVHLERHHHRYPANLSGGQQQRVALARAVVNQPLVLLLDEPFSALDFSLRKKMRIELKQLQRELGITFIFVTHDQEEALTMSDRIVVMNDGAIKQVGTARCVYEEPTNLFTAKFIGAANIFDTTVDSVNDDQISVKIESKQFELKNQKQFQAGNKIHVIIRPEDINVLDDSEAEDKSTMLPGTVKEVIYKGSTVDLVVKLQSGRKIFATEFFDEDDPNLNYSLGEKAWVDWQHGWEVILPNEK